MSTMTNANSIAVCPRESVNVRENFPALASFVDDIFDLDVPDGSVARAIAIKVLPSTVPYVIVQYRQSMSSSWRFHNAVAANKRYGNVITRIATGVYTMRPTGPLGAVIVRLRPEAPAFLFGASLQCFANIKVDLADFFGAQEIKLLEKAVSEAPTSLERVAAVAHFLCAYACPREPDPVVSRAVTCLRRNPSVRVRCLAADLDLSEKSLLRKFQSTFGLSPKQLARGARLEKALTERSHGSAWADIAYGCGFADQAHMINDFNAVLGAPPERALLPASVEQHRSMEERGSSPIGSDYFEW
jgi:AraC-like DNA-binding protein